MERDQKYIIGRDYFGMKMRSLILTILGVVCTSILYAWRGDVWGPISRETIVSNAAQMIDSTWTPLNNITNVGTGPRNYYSGMTYTGELYSSSNHQSWTEFLAAVSNTPGGITYYGNECTGLVDISWQLPLFYSIPAINSNLGNGYFYALGEPGDGQFVSLLPGDAFYTGGHIFLFSQYNPDGTIGSMEQLPPTARRRTWSWSALKTFRPIRRNLIAGGFAINDRVQTSSDSIVRTCPSFGCSAIWTAPIAAQGTIVGGPTTAEKYQWWQVQYDDNGTYGWTTEGYLKKLSIQTIPCTGSGTTSPVGSITMNLGAYTNSRAIVLNLVCEDSGSDCAWMHFSGDGSTWSAWETFADLKNWVLPYGDGQKVVSVQFANACGNLSTPSTATIILQTSTPDLVVSSLIAPVVARAGATINIADTTANAGFGGAGASTTTFFFSANNALDSEDPAVGSRPVPSLAGGASSTATTAVTLPTGISAGSIFIFAKANSVVAIDDCSFITPCGSIIEANHNNNVRMTKIGIGADLTISALSALITGGNITINDTTQNVGADSADSSQTNFHLSANSSLDSGDTLLNSRNIPALPAGSSSTATTVAAIPAGMSAGTYYIIAQCDASNTVMEGNENNNTKSVALKLMPDFVISSMSVPATASAGSSISVIDATTNLGTVAAGASVTDFYLSVNSTLDSGDSLLGDRNVPSLAVGVSDSQSTIVNIPISTSPGTYYIIAKANDANAAVESNYKNNTKYKAIKIQ